MQVLYVGHLLFRKPLPDVQINRAQGPAAVRKVGGASFQRAAGHASSKRVLPKLFVTFNRAIRLPVFVRQQFSRGRENQGQDILVEARQVATVSSPGKARTVLHAVGTRHISELLRQHHDNRRKVSVAPGDSERTLYRKL